MKRNFAVQTFFLVIFAAIAISGAANAQTIENSLPESVSPSLEYCPKGVATSSCYASQREAENVMRALSENVGDYLYLRTTEVRNDGSYLRYAVRNREAVSFDDPIYAINVPVGRVDGESYCPMTIAVDGRLTISGRRQ